MSVSATDQQQFTGAAVVGDFVYAGSATAAEVVRMKTTVDRPAERRSTLRCPSSLTAARGLERSAL